MCSITSEAPVFGTATAAAALVVLADVLLPVLTCVEHEQS